MNKYWSDRIAEAQQAILDKNIKQVEKQLKKHYQQAMQNAMDDFEATYDKLLATIEDGREATPADLYKLDRYWKLQAQLQQELTKLGDKQAAALSKAFEANFFEVYYSYSKESLPFYTQIDRASARQLIDSIWAPDGISWSQRIWKNLGQLKDTLNEELISVVTSGRPTSVLKQKLMERFGVSYNQADSLARTELANIQTQAAEQRYKDAGVTQVQFWAEKDDRQCEHCGALHGKIFPIGTPGLVPKHPRCRCQLLPVVDVPELDTNE